MPITNLDQLDFNKVYTYADYLNWQLRERLELLRGKITLMSPALSQYHQEISTNILGFIWENLRGQSCKVFHAPFDVRLARKNEANELVYTVVQPDICVVCDLEKLDGKGCVGAPDLVVEILSPGNSKKEMRDKYELYEEAGVKEYWIVHPEEALVLPFVLNEEGIFIGKQPLTVDQTLRTPLLNGLAIPLKEVFSEK